MSDTKRDLAVEFVTGAHKEAADEIASTSTKRDEERDVRSSVYWRTNDGDEIRVQSYATDAGQFYRVIDDTHEMTIAAGGPYATREQAQATAGRVLMEVLDERDNPQRDEKDRQLKQGLGNDAQAER